VGEPWEICITFDFIVKNSSLPLWLLERGKEVKETPTLVVTSTTRTYACLSGEPNLGINICVLRAYCCCDYLFFVVSLSLKLFLRFWSQSTNWWCSKVKEALRLFHLTTRKWGCKLLASQSSFKHLQFISRRCRNF